MALASRILWIDAAAAGSGAALLLVASDWLSPWHGLSANLLRLMGAISLLYAAYALTLAASPRRSARRVALLAVANLAWAMACLRWAVLHFNELTLIGLVHLVAEAGFVAALGISEWRSRERIAAGR